MWDTKHSGSPLPFSFLNDYCIELKELSLVLCDNLEGWDGVGGGREVLEEGGVYTYGWFMLMYGRNQHNTVKQLASNWK